MSEMQDHIEYLKFRLGFFLKEPEYNQNQIKTYQTYIEKAMNAKDFKDYIAKLAGDANFFSVAKAEYADRALSQMRAAGEMSDSKTMAAWKKGVEEIQSASNHSSLFTSFETARQNAEQSKQLIRDQIHTAMEMLVLLTAWKIEPAENKKNKASLIKASYARLLSLDPDFRWESLQKPPYNRFYFYDQERSNLLKQFCEEALHG